MSTGIVEHLEKQLKLKRITASYGGSIAANGAVRRTASEVGYTIPTGYYPVGITYFSTASANLALDHLNLQATGTDYFIAVKNVTGSSVSATSAVVDVLFAPEWMVEMITADTPAKSSGDIMREPVFKIGEFRCDYTNLAANAGQSFTRSDMGFFCPEGYEVFSLVRMSASMFRVSLSSCDPLSPDRTVSIRNTYTSSQSSSVWMNVAFINRKFMQPDPRKGLIIYWNRPTKTSAGTIEYTLTGTDFSVYPPKSTDLDMTEKCGVPVFPQGDGIRANCSLYFFGIDPTDQTQYDTVKCEAVNGAEYVTITGSYPYITVKISEDWTDKQIILKFTFD